MRFWLKYSMFLVCAATFCLGGVQGRAQQERSSILVLRGEQAVGVVLKNYALLSPKAEKPLPRNGNWSAVKVSPASCPQNQEACVEVFYKVPAASVSCSWVVLLSSDGAEGKFLAENDDAEHYWMRVVSMRDAKALVVKRKKPVFPPIAILAHVSGNVTIEAIVDQFGKVQNIRMVGGPAMVQPVAADAARNWIFRPMMVGSRAVPYKVDLVFTFLAGAPPFAPTGEVEMKP
jgi:hypothetical protein